MLQTLHKRLDQAFLKETDNATLLELLNIFGVTPVCQVFIAEGNAWADWLASPARTAPQPDMLIQARSSHAFFHQGVGASQR